MSLREEFAARGVPEEVERILRRHATTWDELEDCTNREQHVTRARASVYLWLHDDCEWSDVSIAKLFGYEHSTVRTAVIYARERVNGAASSATKGPGVAKA